MSSDSAGEIRARIGQEARLYQSAGEALDAAAARRLGINRTDLRCLEILRRGWSTPGALAAELGMTTGSVTAMLDRLSKSDYIERHADPDGDRRKVVVRITDRASDLARQVYGPVLDEDTATLDGYSAAQLETVAEFLRRGREARERHRAWISEQPS